PKRGDGRLCGEKNTGAFSGALKGGTCMNTVFVIGAGTMGLDIAQVFAASGKSVVVRDISDDIVSKAAARLEKGLQKRVERGKMAAEAKEALLARIRFTTALEEAKDADLVIEAIVENLGVKKDVFAQLDALCKP